MSHTLRLLNIFCEYDEMENCAQVLEEEIYRMFGTKSLNDEHDCNVVSMNSLNIHDANDMQSHKLGEAMFDGDGIFCPPSFDEQIYYDESMPPIYDDYSDGTYALKNNDNHETCHLDCWCQNRRISGRGSRTVRLRRMVIGGRGHDVLPRFRPS